MNGEVRRISGVAADLTSYMAQAERSLVLKIVALCALLWIGVCAMTSVVVLAAHRGDDHDRCTTIAAKLDVGEPQAIVDRDEPIAAVRKMP